MTAVLITGLPGVGKSSLVRELIKRNHDAYDADLVVNTHDPERAPKLGNWVDAQGRISREYRSSAEWRSAHTFKWDEPTVQRLVSESQGDGVLFLAGVASNVYDLTHFFDGVIALKANGETLTRRQNLDSRLTPYPFESDGNSLAEWEANILAFEARVRNLQAEFVDAESSIPHVADAVLRATDGIIRRGPGRQLNTPRR